MAPDNPYLSVVATARNDNHGGNLLGRMQLFVNGLLEQCRRHNLPAELVLVEWNPPADKLRLAEALSWPTDGSPCAVRIIEVPAEVHNRYKHARALPLYQMIAKNVGIRRARGDFVLTTNVDLLFNDELMRFLAARELRQDRMYRIDRHDVPASVPANAPLDQQLAYCSRNRLRINARNRIVFLGPGRNATRSMFADLHTAWKHAPIRKKLKALVVWPVFLGRRLGWFLRYPILHTNGCGDFTLLPRDAWFKLHGYPELDVFSMHLDSLAVHAAHHAGFLEEVLADPMRIYHIDHGSGWTPEGEAKLNARLTAAGIEQLTIPQFAELATQMAREQRPLIFSSADWGLAREVLPEAVVRPGTPQPALV